VIHGRGDGSSLFVIGALAIVLLVGSAWVWSRYRPSSPPLCTADAAAPIGCGLTELP